jgi:hypothetical protein
MPPQGNRSSTEHWRLQGSKAQLACGVLVAELDVERPMLGLRNLRLPVETIDGWLMAVNIDNSQVASEQRWQPDDVYARGSDLVATYREPAGQPFHLQVYWRAAELKDRESGALEAIVSIQTREWEAYPSIALTSALDVSKVQLHASGVDFLSRHDWSYVEVSPAGDFEATIGSLESGLSRSCWSYGQQFMERGVIRRLRLRSAFVPIDSAEDAIERIASELASEPPLLTA